MWQVLEFKKRVAIYGLNKAKGTTSAGYVISY
jgi:hypothetical protein